MYAYLALATLQVAGGFQQADIIRQNGELQSRVNDMNAQYAELDAHNALVAGESTSAKYQGVVDSTIGATRAAYAGSNVSVGYGTAGAVETDNRLAGMLNTLQIQRSARDKAMGYQTQAINLRLGGQMMQLQSGLNASATQNAGIMKAAGSVVGYELSDSSTGRGRDRDSGTSDQAWKSKTKTMDATSDGLGWWSRGEGDNPGFFGHEDQAVQWKPMSAEGNYYWDSVSSGRGDVG